MGDDRLLGDHWTAKAALALSRRPGRALLGALLALAIAAPGLLRLELRTDGSALVPSSAPAIQIDSEIRERFGLRDPLLVLLESEHREGIFRPETLSRLEALTHDLIQLESLDPEYVVSLATERSPRFHPETYDFLGMLSPPASEPGRLEEIRSEVDATDILHGTLVSSDRSATVVVIGVPNEGSAGITEASTRLDRRELYYQVLETARAYEGEGHRVTVVGAPAAEALLGEHVVRDLALLIPLVFLVVGLTLALACGHPTAAVLGLSKVGAAQIFTFGILGWAGEPVYLTTAMIPVVLATVGIADEVHLLWSLYRRPVPGAAWHTVERTLRELSRPVVFTSLTTAVGFLAFTASDIRPVASFGLFVAVGVLFSMAWSLVVTPSLWQRLPEARRTTPPARLGGRLAGLGLGLARSHRLTLPLFGTALVLLAAGIPRLQVQDSWIHNFSATSELRQATEHADELLAGTHVLHLALTFDPPPDEIPSIPAASGPLLAPSALYAVQDFEEFLREQPEAGAVLGLASHLSTTAFLWAERREEGREFIDSPHWIHLHIRRLANVRGEARRRELIDDELRSTVVTVLLKGADYRKTARLLDAVQDYERNHLRPRGIGLELAGDLAVSQTMIPAIVRNQVGSLLLALVGCGLVAGLLFRSLHIGILAIVPSAAGLLCTLGILGWIGLPLGVATSMFCAVTLGIGVDYSLHLLARHRSLRREASVGGSSDPGERALRAVAPAILIDAAAVILGFGLLLGSSVPTNRWLGSAVAVALAASALFTLAGTGGLLLARDRRLPRSRPAHLSNLDAVPAPEKAG